ncbi:MAG TPA: aspartate--tRNA(Asn) ligase [Ktedonobacterales bacterium]|nr:aspartate--tRNA(Asn) ligase [Ktedonobacterales bacterium]
MGSSERLRTVELGGRVGERARVMGWLHSRRAMGGITFLVVRDGWGLAQVVAEGAAPLTSLAEAGAGVESVIAVEGIIAASAQAPGGCELREPRIEVIAAVASPPPVALNKRQLNAALGTLLTSAVVSNRHPARRATLRLGSGIMRGFRAALGERHFTEVQTPKIVAAATESGANVFRLDYFGRPAFLAQSPQFYKQIMVGVYERVFEVGPVFRAEPHDTTRHINEYVSLDAEMGFIEDHFTVMALLREVIASMMAALHEQHASDLRLTGTALPGVPTVIPHLHFAEAQELILRRHGVDVRGEPDLSPQDERWLGDWARAEHGSEWLFVTGYPMRKRPFYTHPDPARPEYSNSFDLLFRGVELATGGQRRHLYADYVAALAAAGLPLAPFASYLDAFRYGMPPHGGFAIGLERFVTQLVGLPSVKLATTFPRDLHRLEP